MNITSKRLDDYRNKLRWDIKCLELEIYEMVNTDAGIGNSTIMDYRDGYPRPQSVVGFDRNKYMRKVEILKRKEGSHRNQGMAGRNRGRTDTDCI